MTDLIILAIVIAVFTVVNIFLNHRRNVIVKKISEQEKATADQLIKTLMGIQDTTNLVYTSLKGEILASEHMVIKKIAEIMEVQLKALTYPPLPSEVSEENEEKTAEKNVTNYVNILEHIKGEFTKTSAQKKVIDSIINNVEKMYGKSTSASR